MHKATMRVGVNHAVCQFEPRTSLPSACPRPRANSRFKGTSLLNSRLQSSRISYSQRRCQKFSIFSQASGDSISEAPDLGPRKKLSVWVSGGGSNMKAIHKATQDGRIHGDITHVVSDKPGCGGWEYAEEHGITTQHFPPRKGEQGLTVEELVEHMKNVEIDYVLLAGYLKLVPGEMVKAFPRAVLNIHPALLPAFGGKGYYGMNVHKAVVASGARVSGPTIHFVDEEYDKGKIAAQRIVPVFPTDSPEEVQKRVLAQEHQLFPEVVGRLCSGKFEWREDDVIMFKPGPEDGDSDAKYV